MDSNPNIDTTFLVVFYRTVCNMFRRSQPNEAQFKHLFIEKEDIGRGSFGTVHKVFHRIEKQNYAMKKIDFKGVSGGIRGQYFREIQIMAKLESDYVIHHKTSWIENKCIYIVMELCYKTLRGVLQQKQLEFNRKQFETMTSVEYYITSELFREILEGINYLHKLNPPIIHRDLKPTNILITFGTNGRFVKLADFGLATYQEIDDQTHTKCLGTDKYVSPEVSSGRKYDTKSDIYSLGVITQELFDIDIYDATNDSVNRSLLRSRYKTIYKYIVKMMQPMKDTRPNCERLLTKKISWYLDINEIEIYVTHENLNEVSIEKSFHKFFIKTKLMYK